MLVIFVFVFVSYLYRYGIHFIKNNQENKGLEIVSIAEPLHNRQHARAKTAEML